MQNKQSDSLDSYLEESKDANIKFNLSKFEHDLFHEEDYVPGKIVRVKKIGTPSKGEKWKIYQDDKIVMTIDGKLLSNKERTFLYSYEGISFMISQYKNNVNSMNKFKKNLKEILQVKSKLDK